MNGTSENNRIMRRSWNDRWSSVLGLGISAGLLFRLGPILQSRGGSYGILLIALGFIIVLPIWAVKPYYKPLISVVLGFAAADTLTNLL